MMRHLDSEYSRHFLQFELTDGSVLSSRVVNWRDTPLHDIVVLTCSIRGHVHTVRKADYPTFVEFVHFRTEAFVQSLMGSAFVSQTDREWAIGWTDGRREYMQIIDFATGKLKERREFVRSSRLFPTHFHPHSKTSGLLLPT